jgi:hypothetical protein
VPAIVFGESKSCADRASRSQHTVSGTVLKAKVIGSATPKLIDKYARVISETQPCT